MAHVFSADIIASVEKWLYDNLPDSSVTVVPSTSDAPRAFDGTLPDRWISVQWVAMGPQADTRADRDWVSFDLRLLCYSRTNDRLEAAEIADGLKGLIRNSTLTVTDRTDGSTTVGYLRFNEVGITPPDRDRSGRLVSVVDVTGWVTTS